MWSTYDTFYPKKWSETIIEIKDTYVQSRDCYVACASVNYYYISVKLLYKRKKKEKEKNEVHDSKDRNNEIIGRITICHNSQNLKRDK